MSLSRLMQLAFRPLKGPFDRFKPVYRAHVADHLAPMLEDGMRVLDVGCDDGAIASLVMERNPTLQFEGVDVQDLRPCSIPRRLYDGKRLPFDDGAFDAVIAVDMLHHTHRIRKLIAEMSRVSRKLVLIKDHQAGHPVAWTLVSAADFLSNAPYGIPCAFNYPSLRRWKRYIDLAGLDVVELRLDLYLGRGTIARYNPLFKLQKRDGAT